MKSRLARPLFVLAILALLGGCSRQHTRKPSAVGTGVAAKTSTEASTAVGAPTTGTAGAAETATPLAILKKADAALPEAAFAKLATFEGARLFAYMNGAAEAYYAKGFRVLATADTKWRKTEARIELYQVDTAANAKALFEEFLADGSKELPAGLGSAAWYARELEGIFHRGPYFCRIIVYGNDNEARQLLDTLAATIDQAIPG